MDDGADGVELDVRLARDGVPIVIHDANLRRTGSRAGSVARMNSDELQRTDVCQWFNRLHPHLAGAERERQFVPTLSQVFSLFSHRNESAKIYVEIKTEKVGSASRDIGDAVIEMVRAHDMRDRVIIVSFNLKALSHIKSADGSVVCGALFESRNMRNVIRHRPMFAAAFECGADEILLPKVIATRKVIELARENGLLPVVWTVDDPEWLRRRAGSGVHAVITNNPLQMRMGLK